MLTTRVRKGVFLWPNRRDFAPRRGQAILLRTGGTVPAKVTDDAPTEAQPSNKVVKTSPKGKR